MGRFTGVLGLLTMLGLAYLFSTNRRAIKLKMVIWGLGLADRASRFWCSIGRPGRCCFCARAMP